MSKRLKIILTIVVVVLVTGFFLLGRTAYFIAGSVSCGVTGVYSDLNNNPSSFSTDWDKYSSLDFSEYYMNDFESFNITNGEITLSGWWFDNKDSEKTVVILHGVGSSKQSSGVLLSAGMLHKKGFDIVVFDYQDHGSSTCVDKVHGAGVHEAENTADIINWLVNEKGKNSENIGLLGFSLGGMVALNAHYTSDDFTASIVVDPPVDFNTIMKEELEYQGVPSIVGPALRFYVRVANGEKLDRITPELALENGQKQELLIISNLLDERVQPHHRDDLVVIAKRLGIEHTIKYYDYGHVENIYAEVENWDILINEFFDTELSN